MTIRLGITGATGRMGQALITAIGGLESATLAGAIEHSGHPDIGVAIGKSSVRLGDDIDALCAVSDVIIDFSTPVALKRHLDATVSHGKAIVVGTTGFEQLHMDYIDTAAESVPVLQSANMSLGIHILASLVRQTAARLAADWDIEILEMHHRYKVDSPSGTALLLGRAAAEGRAIELSDRAVRQRDGITGARQAGDIGFAILRGGSVAGDHTVIFAGDQERLELTHRAESRAVFAYGALHAALWLAGKQAGRYTMGDVVN